MSIPSKVIEHITSGLIFARTWLRKSLLNGVILLIQQIWDEEV